MVLDNFSIVLDNVEPSGMEGVFLAGQIITGRVHLSVSVEPLKFKELSLECKGRYSFGSFNRSTIIENSVDRSWTQGHVYHTAREDYLCINLPILSSESGQVTLEVGQHSYPFSFKLPSTIPLPFKGSQGHVYYILKSEMILCSPKLKHMTSLGFTVTNQLDLNLHPLAMMTMTVSVTKKKTVGFWRRRSCSITINAWITQSGYIPGQTFYFNATVENFTEKTIKGSSLKLKQITSFHAHDGKVKTSIRIIKEVAHDSFGRSDTWVNVPIVIPSSLAPSGPAFCNFIKISYQIEFIVDPGAMASKLKIPPMGITIGNIALLPSTALAPLAVAEVYESPKIEEGVVPDEDVEIHVRTIDGDPGKEKDGTNPPPNIALLPSVAAHPTLEVVAEVFDSPKSDEEGFVSGSVEIHESAIDGDPAIK